MTKVSGSNQPIMSLSARRAWIEIAAIRLAVLSYYVALRKESVDRNRVAKYRQIPPRVALRKESVDRNGGLKLGIPDADCRSPQGERG